MKITSDQYASALKILKNDKSKKVQNGFLMVEANYYAFQRKITAAKLAKSAGYDGYSTGNNQYGVFARELCKILEFIPEYKYPDGSPMWTFGICDSIKEKDRKGHFQWVLKDEVAEALEIIGLVKPVVINDVLHDLENKEKELEGCSSKERKTLIKARVGQGVFRERLINHWEGCSVTGYGNTDFLIASHIKPWRDCDASEAIDMTNGLLLLPNLDKAFDNGFISFTNKGEIIISSQLDNEDLENLHLSKELKLRWCYPQHYVFLSYHRDVVFRI